ncbi:PLP-dependent transferase [Anopheles sinensis]|uniref:PLP-dependent transferase n=1 Tax=Anopheles sinensis TaxID=74873 RepID=A0A084W934_ANOSI|nr:PLP-dependent transferase [Anopheles sinensis]
MLIVVISVSTAVISRSDNSDVAERRSGTDMWTPHRQMSAPGARKSYLSQGNFLETASLQTLPHRPRALLVLIGTCSWCASIVVRSETRNRPSNGSTSSWRASFRFGSGPIES